MRDLLVVTGLSGSGKSTVMHGLEDAGFFCVDNLPANIIPTLLAGFSTEQEADRIAIACDSRSQSDFEQLVDILQGQSSEWNPRIIYLQASTDSLVARFKKTRRPHPGGNSIIDAIEIERQLLMPLRLAAHTVIDTTDLSEKELQVKTQSLVEQHGFGLQFVSFGHRWGHPSDADISWDVRFLPNPYYDLELRLLDGLDDRVQRVVLDHTATVQWLALFLATLDVALPQYAEEGKQHLVVCIGCTGGQHRSVSIVEYLAQRYSVSHPHIDVSARHRNLDANVQELQQRRS